MKMYSMKKYSLIKIFMIMLFFCLKSATISLANPEYNIINKIEPIVYDKTWKITLNQPVDIGSIQNKVYVKDSYGTKMKVNIELGKKENEILVNPPLGGYEFGEKYSLIVSESLKSSEGQSLNKGTELNFRVEELPYIEYFTVSKDVISEGEEFSIIVDSNRNGEVQYYAEAINNNTGERISLNEKYSENVNADKPYILLCEKGLPQGKYTLKLYMKRANSKGVVEKDGIDYDDYKEKEFEVISNDNAINYDIKLEGDGVDKLKDKYYATIGSTINIKIGGINYEHINLNIYNTTYNKEYKNIKFDKDIKEWYPEYAGEYILEFIYDDKNGTNFKNIINLTVDNIEIRFVEYDMTLEEFARKQKEESNSITYTEAGWRPSTVYELEYFLNPDNFMDDKGIYQFLVLNYTEGMSVEDANKILENKGILHGKGESVLEGAKKYNINPAYLISHTLLETGNGSSKLANGVEVSSVDGQPVEPKIVYNMYGIQAVDSDPVGRGAEYAYKQGWFTPEEAIIEGAKWIGEQYINSDKYNQNTLYKMRWNKDVIWHQYATDIEWSVKQVNNLKKYTDLSPGLKLIFEIPVYKK